jgi:hypothetical protein
VVTLKSIHMRTGPLGTYMHGRAFQVAADASRGLPGHMPGVTAFLYCRALELAFKAYLVLRGQSVRSVRAFKHDLGKLLIETDARGIDHIVTLNAGDKDLIRQAAGLYEEHKLGYYDLFHTLTGPKLPLDQLSDISRRLLDALERPCLAGTDTETWSPLPPARGRKVAGEEPE